MLIGSNSKYLLKKVRSKSKMYEYDVPLGDHIEVEENAPELLLITIGAIGDVSANILRKGSIDELSNSRKELEFASKFFDSFLSSKLDEGFDDYYLSRLLS